jgi:hypothetical protein
MEVVEYIFAIKTRKAIRVKNYNTGDVKNYNAGVVTQDRRIGYIIIRRRIT